MRAHAHARPSIKRTHAFISGVTPSPCRDRPVPIPAPGIQLTTLTHVEDVASMLASVPGNPAAVAQHYNVCSDRCISFVGRSGNQFACLLDQQACFGYEDHVSRLCAMHLDRGWDAHQILYVWNKRSILIFMRFSRLECSNHTSPSWAMCVFQSLRAQVSA